MSYWLSLGEGDGSIYIVARPPQTNGGLVVNVRKESLDKIIGTG